MRTLIDCRMCRMSGVGRYIQNLVPWIVNADTSVRYGLIGRPEDFDRLGWRGRLDADFIECRAKIYSVAEQVELARLSRRDVDLFWSPHFNIPVRYQGPLVVTIHDMFHLAMLSPMREAHKYLYARFMFQQICSRADAVICVSEFTRREFGRLASPGHLAMLTIHNGIGQPGPVHPAARRMHRRPYLLYVGNLKPHKNVRRLLQAFQRIKDVIPHDLLIIGKTDGFITGDATALKSAKEMTGRVFLLGEVEDADLTDYYRQAAAFVFPSLYEGFGLPPLEAMANGCPVIVSNSAAMPEVCQEAALYCDAASVEDMAAKILHLLHDRERQRQLAEYGRIRASQFDWVQSARQTLTFMRAIAAKR